MLCCAERRAGTTTIQKLPTDDVKPNPNHLPAILALDCLSCCMPLLAYPSLCVEGDRLFVVGGLKARDSYVSHKESDSIRGGVYDIRAAKFDVKAFNPSPNVQLSSMYVRTSVCMYVLPSVCPLHPAGRIKVVGQPVGGSATAAG